MNLNIQGLVKYFNGVKALADFSCSISEGEILGLIGPNGAGKTTFFNLVSGFLTPDSGTITFNGIKTTNHSPQMITKLGIRRTFQELRLIRQVSVLDNVLFSFGEQLGEKLYNVLFHWRRIQGQEREYRQQAYAFLENAGLSDKANDPAEGLSYGQQKLLSLVCCLSAESKLLLLDEPIAGIAPEMIEKILGIIQELPRKGKSVILIEHDINAVMQLCDRVIFMDAGAKVCEGTPGEVKNDPRVIEAYLD